VHFISECIVNVMNGNIKLKVCDTRKLQKHKVALRNFSDKHLPLFAKKKPIVQRGEFLLPLLSTVLQRLGSLIFRNR